MIGVMIGIWSIINGFGNLAGALITDYVGRVKLMGQLDDYANYEKSLLIIVNYYSCGLHRRRSMSDM